MIPDLLPFWIFLLTSINNILKQWTRPAPILIGTTLLVDLSRNRADLGVENAIVHDLFFRPTYNFIIMELHTRRILHTAVTLAHTDAWIALQLRAATPQGKGPKYLLHDRDRKYGYKFAAVAASSGIMELKSPNRAPKANAICERIIGSLKRECLDHIVQAI
jgi:hypothetical protein